MSSKEQTGGITLKIQPIINFIELKNGWNVGMPKECSTFQSENEVILVDEDYDVIAAFVFEEDSVVIKKTGWQVEPKVYFNKKQLDIHMLLEEIEA